MDYDLDDWRIILATFALIICMLWDVALQVMRDYFNVKIRPWIPTNLFVLSALTIQILCYVQIQKVNVFGPSHENALEVLVRKQLGIDAARLTMCVFVGCLLPAMAMAGTQGSWSSIAALFLSFFFHIATEIYALQNAKSPVVEREAGPWFVSSGAVLLAGASSLLLFLGAVLLSGKLERDGVRCDISKILSRDVENDSNSWETLRNEVMKSWIAARAWKTRYFLMTSLFSPGAGVIVTICVAVMAAKVGCRSSLLHGGDRNLTFNLQCVFILVGWILMLCRWFKSSLYCSIFFEKINFIENFSIGRRYFSVPVAVLVNPIWPRLSYFLLRPKFRWRYILVSLLFLVPLLPFCLLILAIGLLWSLCLICGYFSALALANQFVQRLCKLDKKSVLLNGDQYLKYQSILDGVGFPEEDDWQYIFWKVNKRSYEKINHSYCNQKQKRTGLLSIMGNGKLAQNQRLKRSHEGDWMATIARVFRIIADLEIGVGMENALAAYMEAVDVLKFVDYPENIVVELSKIFSTLNFAAFENNIDYEAEMHEVMERELKRGLGREKRAGVSVERELTTEERVRVERVSTAEERVRVDEMLRVFSDNLKPSDERVSNSLLRRLEERSYYNLDELGELLRTLVGHVIVSALSEAPELILKYTKQWAENAEEKKIERAIELAGMVTALLENVVEDGAISFTMVYI